ncbi:hypothetical protein GCM10009676_16000 [Prauserella halophila]|uniref:Peptide chain release factor 1 n=1 Tax=Prauserella halophila TaxID=185641 RepID=A0ABN1W368_9PSEU|nr:Vms1/Ankzf1 family peptidyl-tRNA hydrolase [Prauserella halophila]MCP2236194.1 hypothetical protein [Prauserella halophila]
MMHRSELRDVLAAEGPFACAYFDVTHDTEDSAERTRLQWRSVREELLRQGADESTVDAMAAAVEQQSPPVGTATRALVASHGGLLVNEWLPSTAGTESSDVRWTEVPYVLPLLASTDRPVPYVAVVADRTGATLRAVDGHGDPVSTEDVSGEEHHVHKPRGGGWSHRRIHQHAEETVKRNVRDIADEADQLAQKVSARLLAFAGEAQTRSALRAELSPRCEEIAVEHDAGHRDGEPDLAEHEAWLAELVARQQAEDRDGVVRRFRAATGRDGEAAAGLRDVTSALRDGRVATLLIDRDGLGDRTVVTGGDPLRVGIDDGELSESNVKTTERRADEALPAAAVAGGADVLVVDGVTVDDGVGALLRY